MLKTILIFVGIGGVCYLLAFIADTTSKKQQQNIGLIAIIIVLSLFSGFRRFDVGIDTPHYASYFVYGFSNYQGVEVGYKLLSSIITYIYPNYTFGLTCIAIITNTLFVLRLWSLRYASPFRYSLMIFYSMLYILTFSGIRQWLAVSIVFYATKYVYDTRKLKVAFLLMVVAFFIHNSVVISLLLLIPFVFEKNGSTRDVTLRLLLFVVSPFVAFFAYSVLMSNYGSFFTEYARDSASLGLMIPFRLLILLMMFLFDYSRVKDAEMRNNFFDGSKQNLLTINRLLYFETVDLALNSTAIFAANISRICWYYLAFTPVLYGRCLNKQYGRNSIYLLVKAAVIIAFVYYFFTSVTSETNTIVPFHFFWEQ